jgi:hypothetical protein
MKSGEVYGPLDYARRAQNDALTLDKLCISGAIPGNIEHLTELSSKEIHRLDTLMPYIDSKVTITGKKLEPLDQERYVEPDIFGSFELSDDEITEHGTYAGFAVKRQEVDFDISTSGVVSTIAVGRVVHILKRHQDRQLDRSHNQITTLNISFFPVSCSQLNVDSPIDRHSLIDLKDNRLLAEIDDVVFDTSRSSESLLKTARYLSKLFRYSVKHYGAENELLTQQISYLNSTGYFEGTRATTDSLYILDENMDQAELLHDKKGPLHLDVDAVFLESSVFKSRSPKWYASKYLELCVGGSPTNSDQQYAYTPVTRLSRLDAIA